MPQATPKILTTLLQQLNLLQLELYGGGSYASGTKKRLSSRNTTDWARDFLSPYPP